MDITELLEKNNLVITVDGEIRPECNCYRIRDWACVSYRKFDYYDKEKYIQDFDGEIIPVEDIEDTHFYSGGEWYNSDDWAECAHCGNVYRTDDMNIIDGEWYCKDCCFYCVDCEEWYCKYDEDRYELPNGDYVCQNCRDDHYIRCYCCDNLVHYDNSCYVESEGVDLCEYCYEHNTATCECCGERFLENNLDDGLCNDCQSNSDYDFVEHGFKVMDYNYKPDPVFYGEHHNYMGIGFELEVCPSSPYNKYDFGNAVVRAVGNECYYKHDGSLASDGIEIVSHPHTYKELIKNFPWEKIQEAGKEHGYISHDWHPCDGKSCGFHLHFSREMFGKTTNLQNFTIQKIITFYHIYWKDIMKLSRRTDDMVHWSKENISGDDTRTFKKLIYAAKKSVDSPRYHSERYVAVNNTNSATVEFRLARGTLNPATIRAWIDLHYRLVCNAKNTREGSFFLKDMLQGIRKETIEYIKSRGAFSSVVDTL